MSGSPLQHTTPSRQDNVIADGTNSNRTSRSFTDQNMASSANPHGQDPVRSVKDVTDANAAHEDGSDELDTSGDEKGPNVQQTKRRRVTRACDECRRKKIKCDGAMPCTHCAAYSYECTYDKPSNRRRNPAPQYTAALESRLQRAEALLRQYIPDVDLSDPNLDPVVQREFRNRERMRAEAAAQENDDITTKEKLDPQIMSMIQTVGQLDLNQEGGYDFRGTSSSSVFLRRMKEQFRGLLGYDASAPFLPRVMRPPGLMNLDSPQSATSDSPRDPILAAAYDLPSKAKVRSLCYCTFMCATCMLRFVHQPSFYEQLDRLYERSPETYGAEDHKYMALVYAVCAVGCMYNVSEEAKAHPMHYNDAVKEGMLYYTKARVLLQDITECQDLTSLQALVYTILFLQASSNLAGCYSFLGMALRSAIRMGLHRHLPHATFTPIESESRRRVFWSIRQVDLLVSALLGFPVLLQESDIDQLLPTEVDDEYITKEAILAPPSDAPGSFIQAANAHTKLMNILAKIIERIYPTKGLNIVTNPDGTNTRYTISYRHVKELEVELQDWLDKLPARWRPSTEGPVEVFRPRTVLRFMYAHCQMMLYRPFLHYISPRLTAGKSVDDRYYACAAAGISVSRNVVHIAMEIRKGPMDFGPYWSTLLTQFMAVLSLVFYALENEEKPGTAEIFADARTGHEIIASMAHANATADRVGTSLNELFKKLPDLDKRAKKAKSTKKRPAPGMQQQQQAAAISNQATGRLKAEPMHADDMQGATSSVGRLNHSLGELPQRPVDVTAYQTSQPYSSRFSDLQTIRNSFSGIATPEALSTPTTNPASMPFPSPGPQPDTPNGLYNKLDAMMFSSGDPFAYPNPTATVNLGAHQHQQHQQHSSLRGQHHMQAASTQDSNQFYMSNLYGDIEGQVMGPIPSYLQQQGGSSGTQTPTQSMGYEADAYMSQQPQHHLPSGMSHHRQQQQHQAQQQPNEQHLQARNELETMIANAVSRGDWNDFFGAGQR